MILVTVSKDLSKCYDQVKNSTLCRSGCKLSIFPVFPTTPQDYDPLLYTPSVPNYLSV